MATINFARREIEAKIVYCGPALSGKTTNLKVLHDLVPKVQRGDLHTLDTENDRTLFFDYIPLELGQIAGFTARFKLFSVPGQVVYTDTRREVLRGADAVVFVADSSPDRVEANEQALVDLGEQLKANGLDLATLPVVVQLNKRDVPGAQDATEMARALNPTGAPVVEAVASVRRGVLDTLYKITEIAGNRIRDNLAGRSAALRLTAVERADREADREVVDEHLARVKAVRAGEEERRERLKAAEAARPDDLDEFLLEFVDRPDGGDAAEAMPVDEERTGDMPPPAPAPRKESRGRRRTPSAAAPAPEPPPAARPEAPPAARPEPPPAARPEPPPAARPDPPPAALPTRVPTPAAVRPEPARPVAPPPPSPEPARPAAFAPRPPTPEHDTLPRGLGFEARVKAEVLDGATLEQVIGVSPGPGGDPVLDLVVNRHGTRTRHPMRLTAGSPAAPPRSPVPIVAAGLVGLLAGLVVGMVLGGLT